MQFFFFLSIFGHSPHKSLISVWTFTHRCQCWTVFSYKNEWFTQCLIIYFVTFVFAFAVVSYFRIWMFLRRHRLLRENVLMRTFWLMVEDRLPFMVKVEWKINFTFRLKFGWEAERHVWESVRCCTSYSSKRPVVCLWQSLQRVIQIKIRRGFKQADLCMKSAMFTVANLSGGCSFRGRNRHDWWVSATMICFQSLWSMDTRGTDAEQRICI